MAIHQTLTYSRQGDVRRIQNTITDFDGNPQDPDSHSIQLYDPSGDPIGAAETTPADDGNSVFHQDFELGSEAVAGEWRVEWTITVGTQDDTEAFRFRVAHDEADLYCRVSDVATLIRTDLSVDAVEDIIFNVGQELEDVLGGGDLNETQKKLATMNLAAAVIANREPYSYSAGNIRVSNEGKAAMFREQALKYIQQQRGITVVGSYYQHIDEDNRYTVTS